MLLRFIWGFIKVILFAIGGLAVLGLLLMLAVCLLTSSGQKIADKSVLVFDLEKQVTDRPVDDSAGALARLFGRGTPALQLRAATTALHEAAQDKRITGLYLRGRIVPSGYSSGYGALRELRNSILEFEKSGKPVIAYISDADNRDYYLMSAADQILMNPFGIVAFRGIAAESPFFKGAADKYGVEFTAIRHGKYKSAVEPFTRENFSPENREQLEALIQAIWGEMLHAVATSRKVAPEHIQALADKEPLLQADAAKGEGLVTELAYEGQALDKLRRLTGTSDPQKPIPQVSISDYAVEAQRAFNREQTGKDKIAIVYAEGTIVPGEGDPRSDGQVAGDKFARMIRKLRERKDVKALVLRVNSPGGSAEASEVVLDELRRFGTNRPIIVSMGTVAASGGYFISMAARKIIAEPDTITGSIGVFGLTLNLQKLANDHGVTFDTLKTGALSDLGTITRPMKPEEQAIFQRVIDRIYEAFVLRVAQCRNLSTNRVDQLAQGRVWSGADALKVGLVDEMGGLQDALSVAATEARLGTNYSTIEFPERKGFFEEVAETLRTEKRPLAQMDPASRIEQKVLQEWRWLSEFNDPRGVYDRLPFDLDFN